MSVLRSIVSTGACNLGVPGSNPGWDEYLSSWLCTMLQTVQRHGVYSAAYGTVHYKESLKSFEIRVGHSPGFGIHSVAILSWLWRKRRKAIFIYIFFARYLAILHLSALCRLYVMIYWACRAVYVTNCNNLWSTTTLIENWKQSVWKLKNERIVYIFIV